MRENCAFYDAFSAAFMLISALFGEMMMTENVAFMRGLLKV